MSNSLGVRSGGLLAGSAFWNRPDGRSVLDSVVSMHPSMSQRTRKEATWARDGFEVSEVGSRGSVAIQTASQGQEQACSTE